MPRNQTSKTRVDIGDILTIILTMASLWKRKKSPYWVCCYTGADGRQLKRSTKKRSRNDAMVTCLEWERAEKHAREGNFSEAQARKVLGDILEKTTGERLTVLTIRQFLENWVDSKEVTKAPGTSKRYRHTVDEFLKHLGERAKGGLQSLRPAEIASFRDLQMSDGKSAATANMVLKTLRIPLNLARRQGLIFTNPAEAVEVLPADSSVRDVFTPEQISRILAAADVEWRGMILVARYCGLRLGDAARLTWKNVDSNVGQMVLRFHPQKTRRGATRREHEIPLHPQVEEYLLRIPLKSKRPDAALFPSLSQQGLSGCNGLSAQFQKIMAKAGVFSEEDTRKLEGKGRRFNNLTFHSLRHTFISRLANAGVAQEVRMKLSGHTSEVHQRYTHHELAALRLAMLKDTEDKEKEDKG